MDKEKFIIYMFLFIVILLYCVRVFLNNYLDTNNDTLIALQNQIKEIHRENMNLNVQLLRAESLTTINRVARDDGHVEATYIYLK